MSSVRVSLVMGSSFAMLGVGNFASGVEYELSAENADKLLCERDSLGRPYFKEVREAEEVGGAPEVVVEDAVVADPALEVVAVPEAVAVVAPEAAKVEATPRKGKGVQIVKKVEPVITHADPAAADPAADDTSGGVTV